jgi:hypothetical protein
MNLIAAILLVTQPMTVSETRSFMRTLTQYVLDHHLKKDEKSAQRGMIYEYYDVKSNLWVQGEGLDTMHDGAWFAVAMVNAYRATGDPLYKEVLTKWQLPFYLKMLNHGDELFTSERNDGRPGGARGWQVSKEWLLQGREKGFVPYWWDNGASVSLDMRGRRDNDEHVNFAGRNDWGNRPNPEKRLSGYSHGSSNHMAQDLAVMLQQTWLLLRYPQIAEAAKNLQECRARHGSPNIPAVKAALALTSGDATLRQTLSNETWKFIATARNDWRRALYEFKKDEPVTVPGFADDQQYRYYVALARNGTLPEPAAFRVIYDAFTLPMLYRIYCDDEAPAPGINVFDLHPYKFINGKPTDYRSQRKGPFGKARPIGSRFGPQNMVVSGWALQALKAYPGIWDKAKTQITTSHFFPPGSEKDVHAALERELGGGLRTWEAIFKQYGYIPTGIGAGSRPGGSLWDDFSDTGGYAHLISAASQWIFCLEGKRDWEQHQAPLPQ